MASGMPTPIAARQANPTQPIYSSAPWVVTWYRCPPVRIWYGISSRKRGRRREVVEWSIKTDVWRLLRALLPPALFAQGRRSTEARGEGRQPAQGARRRREPAVRGEEDQSRELREAVAAVQQDRRT